MKTLTVSLADLEGQPHGSHSASTNVTVSARYTSPLVMADGTVIPAAIKSKQLPATGSVSFEVYASDDTAVATASQGFAVVVTAEGKGLRGERPWRVERTVKLLMNTANPVDLGSLAEAVPSTQYDAGLVKTINGVAPDANGNIDAGTATVAQASTTVAGKVELATNAEAATGTDATRAVTPVNLKPLLDAKADKTSTYTKSEVDTMVGSAGGGDPVPVEHGIPATKFGVSSSGTAAANGAALQNALLEARNQKVPLVLPGFTFQSSATLEVDDGDWIVGQGMRNHTLVFHTGSGPFITGLAVPDLTLENFKVQGLPSAGAHGIHIQMGNSDATSSAHAYMRNVYVRAFGGDGFHLPSGWLGRLDHCFAEGNLGKGFYIAGRPNESVGGTSTTLTSCYANNNGTIGYHIDRMNYSALVACAADSNPIGYHLQNTIGITLLSCGAEGSEDRAFVIQNSSQAALLQCQDLGSAVGSIDVLGISQGVEVAGYFEMSPPSGKTFSLRVPTSGTRGHLRNNQFSTSMVMASNNAYWRRDNLFAEPPDIDNLGTSGTSTVAQIETAVNAIINSMRAEGKTW